MAQANTAHATEDPTALNASRALKTATTAWPDKPASALLDGVDQHHDEAHGGEQA